MYRRMGYPENEGNPEQTRLNPNIEGLKSEESKETWESIIEIRQVEDDPRKLRRIERSHAEYSQMKGSCYKCGRDGHFPFQCHNFKGNDKLNEPVSPGVSSGEEREEKKKRKKEKKKRKKKEKKKKKKRERKERRKSKKRKREEREDNVVIEDDYEGARKKRRVE